MEKHFWARVPVKAASAFFYFQKGGKVQHLLHQLKYKKKTEVGFKLGELYGSELKNEFDFQHCDVIIPVPLHWKKQKQRGYNQCDFFADGLSASMEIAVQRSTLFRNSMNESQTRKNRFQRWENVDRIFSVRNPSSVKNKNVLLVDDVMTTGSTLESCTTELLNAGVESICMATIAVAER